MYNSCLFCYYSLKRVDNVSYNITPMVPVNESADESNEQQSKTYFIKQNPMIFPSEKQRKKDGLDEKHENGENDIFLLENDIKTLTKVESNEKSHFYNHFQPNKEMKVLLNRNSSIYSNLTNSKEVSLKE